MTSDAEGFSSRLLVMPVHQQFQELVLLRRQAITRLCRRLEFAKQTQHATRDLWCHRRATGSHLAECIQQPIGRPVFQAPRKLAVDPSAIP
jgi:hypothetical protein